MGFGPKINQNVIETAYIKANKRTKTKKAYTQVKAVS